MIDHAPLIATLGLDDETFGRLDALRRRHFPADRNVIPAHVSLFHHLPGEEADAVASAIEAVARSSPALPLRLSGVMRLGGGFALTVEAPGLPAIHAALARRFDRWLTPQDRQPFRPHVTIMNKAEKVAAALAYESFRTGFDPWPGLGDSIRLWRYRGGPWEPLACYPLAGPGPSRSIAE